LYSAASMLLRSLSAVSQSLASKPREAELVCFLVTRGICEYFGQLVALATRAAALSIAEVEQLPAVESISDRIIPFRGQRVMLDADLARLYGVSTSRLNEQVRRNQARFPADFMFRLTAVEWRSPNLSQFQAVS
jgi:ORF6N domain